jgi:putative hemolysin
VTFCLSAFFSGSETALFSLPPDELVRMRQGRRLDRIASSLRDRPKRLLTTVLFGNMVVNVVFYSVSYLVAIDLGPRIGTSGTVLISLGALTAIIVGGEVMPKNLAVLFHVPLSRAVAAPLFVLQNALAAAVLPLEVTAHLAASALTGRRPAAMATEELQMLTTLAAREGVLDPGAGRMIAEVLGLPRTRISELMVPRVEMVSFDLNDPVEELVELFRRTKLTLIPVHDGDVENVLGVVHIKDVAFRQGGSGVREAIRPIPFLPEGATAEEALRSCRDRKSKTAFVVDEYGAIAGLISVEDMLEEIVGEIADEYDVERKPGMQLLGGGRLRVRGDFSLREWCAAMGVPVPQIDVDTVGGLVMALLDKVPVVGDRVAWRGVTFTVESVARRRAVSLLVEPDTPSTGSRPDA